MTTKGNTEFDKKWGADFLGSVPHESGVYLFRNEKAEVIYVGKAKNLRRRLAQYRQAPQRKAYRKMRRIVKAAATLEFQICPSEKEALLLENKLILDLKPVLNVAGAFSFLYPCLGLKADAERAHLLTLCYTTSPDALQVLGFELYGAFRSRVITGEAFDALAYLLAFLGHHTPAERKQYGELPFTRIISFRQMTEGWALDLQALFRGESSRCLERLVLELLEKPDARQLAGEIQLHLKNLTYFYKAEAVKLRLALSQLGIDGSMIPQNERDRLFLSLGT